ncbi:MAG: hypothetical protein ACRDI2_24795, partial [Chloroflexota bacterium]
MVRGAAGPLAKAEMILDAPDEPADAFAAYRQVLLDARWAAIPAADRATRAGFRSGSEPLHGAFCQSSYQRRLPAAALAGRGPARRGRERGAGSPADRPPGRLQPPGCGIS